MMTKTLAAARQILYGRTRLSGETSRQQEACYPVVGEKLELCGHVEWVCKVFVIAVVDGTNLETYDGAPEMLRKVDESEDRI